MGDPISDKLIVALDVSNYEEASRLVKMLSPMVSWFKVGSRLFTREGPRVCGLVKDAGARLFLDLKFHDIPNTVAGAVRSALDLRADMLTLHASGGEAMLRAALRATAEGGRRSAKLVGVTVLTHFKPGELADIFSSRRAADDLVLNLAVMAKGCGLDGVVASALEVPFIKARLGADFIVVTPGIRLSGREGQDDQASVATPERALREGADYIVVGRPIVAALDPVSACCAFLDRIGEI